MEQGDLMPVTSTTVVATVDEKNCRVTFFSDDEPIVRFDGKEIEGRAASTLATRIKQKLDDSSSEPNVEIQSVTTKGSGVSQNISLGATDGSIAALVIEGDVHL